MGEVAPRGRLDGRSRIRLAPQTRALLSARRRDRSKPRRAPVGRVLLTVLLAFILGVSSLATVGAIAGAAVVSSLSADLPDPTELERLTFSQPTVVYDRTGTVELARFERERRHVVSFDAVPKLILDVTTTAEDRTFWTNDGFDAFAIAAAAVQNITGDGETERGASTITQQLVRARLLPAEVMQGDDRYLRKTLEVIQATRVTAAYPGEAGKEKIVTAYLNEIYYGHEAYGIAAAADIYFGVNDLADLTPAQAALLAGLPKAPSVYDAYRYAVEDDEGRLVVPKDSPPVVRRDYILRELAKGARWTALTPAQLEKALDEPVILVGERPTIMRAPHFSWAVRNELIRMLGSLDAVETGGYRVITTLDWDAQQLAERYVYAAAIIPNLPSERAEGLLDSMEFRKADRAWIRGLRGKDIHNGALVALDYRTGDVLAYVGSGGYYREDLASSKFAPKHDAAAAHRQPGSAFKAIIYTTAFEQRVLTPGSLLLDITTDFGGGYSPGDADLTERGPVLVRDALQMSLNLPAIRALERVGNEPVATTAEAMGINFLGGHDAFLRAGLAGAIGTVETRPVDLTAAFGTLANGGVHVPTRYVLSVQGPDGATAFEATRPEGNQAVSAQSAFLTTDILAGNTDPEQNSFWARTLALQTGPNGSRRPAAAKTGTTDNRKNFSTYGYLPPPDDPEAPGVAVGVWMGNSDATAPVVAKEHATSLTTAGEVWHAFLRDYTEDLPVAEFKEPDGVLRATIDRWSGGRPGSWTRSTIREWFLRGTEPGARREVDRPGLLYSLGCGGWMVDPMKAELGPASWIDDVRAWLERARRGIGTKGEYGSTIAYWYGESSWGGPLLGGCSRPSSGGGGGGGGNGGGGGGGGDGDGDGDGGGDGGGGNGNGNGNGGGNGGGGPGPGLTDDGFPVDATEATE